MEDYETRWKTITGLSARIRCEMSRTQRNGEFGRMIHERDRQTKNYQRAIKKKRGANTKNKPNLLSEQLSSGNFLKQFAHDSRQLLFVFCDYSSAD